MDTTLIPVNPYYCYSGGEWDGKIFKMKLCPYWQRTDHGTIKCEFLGVESLTSEAGIYEGKARALAYAHFGSKEKAFEATEGGGMLWDQLKLCDINAEMEEIDEEEYR